MSLNHKTNYHQRGEQKENVEGKISYQEEMYNSFEKDEDQHCAHKYHQRNDKICKSVFQSGNESEALEQLVIWWRCSRCGKKNLAAITIHINRKDG